MKVTYIGHSGFLVELSGAVLLFDYYTGRLPDLPKGKPLYVFASHSHSDHYNPAILRLRKERDSVTYLFSEDIREKIVGTSEGMHFLSGAADWSDGVLRVRTLDSTDLGVAFLLEAEGRLIYHSGDLHWWTWVGEETEEEYRQMTRRWRTELERLCVMTEGRPLDLAFLVLDPRQGERYGWGMTDFLRRIPVLHAFPMHSQGDLAIAKRYLASEEGQPFAGVLRPLHAEGETITIE